MELEYDRERTAALVKEAQELTRYLKAEAEGLKKQMARVLDGGEDDTQTGGDVAGTVRPKSIWSLWRSA